MYKPLNSCLILEDGTIFYGTGIGDFGTVTGEVCFNTALTGYQEVLTDPSYSGQIVAFSCPHIGNVGVNSEDMESAKPYLKGIVLKDRITQPSNYRSEEHLNEWLIKHKVTGISQVDTRCLIKYIRSKGPIKALIHHRRTDLKGENIEPFLETLKQEKGTENQHLAFSVSTRKKYEFLSSHNNSPKIIVLDFGLKLSIPSHLKSRGCQVVIMPATSSFQSIIAEIPDGILISNGPGDPRSLTHHTTPMINKILDTKIPLLGICLGHQLLGLALGETIKIMATGHHGINHPVRNIIDGSIEITSQNHEFILDEKSLPSSCVKTHISIFDETLQGIEVKESPAFSVQFHPEASPGPHDSSWLFDKFLTMVSNHAKKR